MLTTHAEVAASGDVPAAVAALADGIGDPAVRHRGTIGGSIANNNPAADYPAACLALGATIHTNTRDIAAACGAAVVWLDNRIPAERQVSQEWNWIK